MLTFQVFESINDQIDKAITPLQTSLYQQLTSSLFIIQIIFKLYNVKLNNSKIIIPEEYLQIRSKLAKNIKKFHLEFNNKKQILESPNSLDEYQSALSKSLYFLFEGLISKLLKYKKKKADKKQIKRNKLVKPLN